MTDVALGSGRLKPVPKNAKIADITHADTAKHFLDLAVALSESRKIVSMHIRYWRISGTGTLYIYPNEGTVEAGILSGNASIPVIIAEGTNRLQYALETSNDDFDLYCLGYVIEV